MYHHQRDQMGFATCTVGIIVFFFLRMVNWREDYLSLNSPITAGFPVAPLLERNRKQVDSMREKNFQNRTGHALPPCPSLPCPPSLYLFLYNSLDEGEWS